MHEERWFIVTDLLPAQADIAWYAMRAWIECGFKDTKRGGWTWHHTKMTDPRRAERHWLVMAVATLWVISVGGEVDANLPVSSFETFPPTHIARRLSEAATYQLFCAWDPYHRCGAGDGRSVADGAFVCVLMAQFAS